MANLKLAKGRPLMNSKPRILALVASRVIFGQERANLLVLETLKDQGCDILAVVEDHPSFQIMQEELSKIGIPYIEVPQIGRRYPGYILDFVLGNPMRYVRATGLLRKHIRAFKPTHIHVPNPFAFMLAAGSAPANLPIVYRIGDKPTTHNPIWRWVWSRVCARVNYFVADSEFIAQNLRSLKVPNEKITVIYSKPPSRHSAQPPVEETKNPNQIVFIGQITQNKGVDRLIEAMRLLAVDYPDSRLKIAGPISDGEDGKWARHLRDMVCRTPELRGRVSFLGNIEDIFDLLAGSGFIAIPSVLEEAFGLVCVEAKAAGRPAVIFASGGLKEQIRHGEDGFICDDISVEALAEGLRYYLSSTDRVRAHGLAASSSLEALGTHQFADRWMNIYSQTLTST